MILFRSVEVPEVGFTATWEAYAPTGCGGVGLVSSTAASISSLELLGKPSLAAFKVECPVMGSTCTQHTPAKRTLSKEALPLRECLASHQTGYLLRTVTIQENIPTNRWKMALRSLFARARFDCTYNALSRQFLFCSIRISC